MCDTSTLPKHKNGLLESGVAVSDVYKVDASSDELERLANANEVQKLIRGGIYPKDAEPIVTAKLTGVADPAVLDVGSGSGVWAREIAEMFPQAKVVGVDLVMSGSKNAPLNCTFLQGNITTDVSKFAGSYDIVHCARVLGHNPDYAAFLATLTSCLKKGGLLLLEDGDMAFYRDKTTLYLPAYADKDGDKGTHSWTMTYYSECANCLASKGGYRNVIDQICKLMRVDDVFDDIREQVRFLSCNYVLDNEGDFVGDEKQRKISELGGINAETAIEHLKPVLLGGGFERTTVDKWASESLKEVKDPTFPLYLKDLYVWAIKK